MRGLLGVFQVLPIVSPSLSDQEKDRDEMIPCTFEVFWLSRGEL